MLKGRVKQLSEAGLKVEYLCSSDLLKEEPDLLVEKDSAAAFLPDDYQLDAQRTIAYIEKVRYHWGGQSCLDIQEYIIQEEGSYSCSWLLDWLFDTGVV
ncbi:hypothetical protein RJT34_16312 [Clitoria ternatea]|uniref:Uncharacterized protein n=1 Tax=Clitoria ternatea TaxID=43366 RepID=A0AAN9J8H0_CLITE